MLGMHTYSIVPDRYEYVCMRYPTDITSLILMLFTNNNELIHMNYITI